MDQINKIIKTAFSTLVFCIGLWVMIYEMGTYMKAIHLTREMLKEDILYQQQNSDNLQITSYSELVAIMLEPLEYEIEIDGRNISRNEYNRSMIAEYEIKRGSYTKSYQYDAEGNICRIIYSHID